MLYLYLSVLKHVFGYGFVVSVLVICDQKDQGDMSVQVVAQRSKQTNSNTASTTIQTIYSLVLNLLTNKQIIQPLVKNNRSLVHTSFSSGVP